MQAPTDTPATPIDRNIVPGFPLNPYSATTKAVAHHHHAAKEAVVTPAAQHNNNILVFTDMGIHSTHRQGSVSKMLAAGSKRKRNNSNNKKEKEADNQQWHAV